MNISRHVFIYSAVQLEDSTVLTKTTQSTTTAKRSTKNTTRLLAEKDIKSISAKKLPILLPEPPNPRHASFRHSTFQNVIPRIARIEARPGEEPLCMQETRASKQARKDAMQSCKCRAEEKKQDFGY
jgi:hypothetical protein